jgi:hypothetical protein
MSIFGAIKKAIFGDKGPLGGQFSGRKDQPAQAPGQQPGQPPAMPQMQRPQQQPQAQPAPAQQQPVDVEQVLTQIAQQKGNPNLNWRTSIVDLLKLLDLDSSLQARKELGDELGIQAGADGSAEQNVALHKAVMRELEKNGGRVPAALKD